MDLDVGVDEGWQLRAWRDLEPNHGFTNAGRGMVGQWRGKMEWVDEFTGGKLRGDGKFGRGDLV